MRDQTSSISSKPVALLPDGRSVDQWTLVGAGGLKLSVLTLGGIVTGLLAPDRSGHLADVVLGLAGADQYLAGHPYFGAIIGRVAGRTTGAQFTLDGQTFPLAVDDPPNHVHGGETGFDKRLWTAAVVTRTDGAPSLALSYLSPDGEEGYPGNVDVAVTYTVTKDNSFRIDTHATTDRATPFSLTHHSYFNLAGEGTESIEDHELEVSADDFVPNDDAMGLLGRKTSVAGRPNDLNHARRLGDVMPGWFKSHGDLYFVRKTDVERTEAMPVHTARLTHRRSGRVLNVLTNEPCLQLYTGVSFDGSIVGKSGQRYEQFAGLCLECEGYPDGANAPEIDDIILRPGTVHRRMTSYSFTTI